MRIRVLPIFAALALVLLPGCANYHAAAAQVVFELEQNHTATTQAILYIENSAKIDSVSNPVLDGVAQFLERNPAAHLEIFDTSTNADGTEFDLPLSQKRAEAAKAYIVAFGIDPNRIHAEALEQIVVSPR